MDQKKGKRQKSTGKTGWMSCFAPSCSLSLFAPHTLSSDSLNRTPGGRFILVFAPARTNSGSRCNLAACHLSPARLLSARSFLWYRLPWGGTAREVLGNQFRGSPGPVETGRPRRPACVSRPTLGSAEGPAWRDLAPCRGHWLLLPSPLRPFSDLTPSVLLTHCSSV